MIGIERERNWIFGVSEFYDSPISSLCQKVSTSSRVFLMFWGPSLCWNLRPLSETQFQRHEGLLGTFLGVRVSGAWR